MDAPFPQGVFSDSAGTPLYIRTGGISQVNALAPGFLERASGSRVRRVDLAERLGMTASGVTRSLLPLEKRGLVSRQADPRGARVGYAALTEAGQELLNHATASALVIARETIEMFSAGQITPVSLLLGRLAGMNSSNS